MKRVVLIHWNAAEAPGRVERLHRAGFAVEFLLPQGGKSFAGIRANPPSVLVIDLGRLPSHGRAVAIFFRQQKVTRYVPLVFVDGALEKISATRKLLPDAVYAD